MKECRIELINSCNYKCDFCPVHKQTRKREYMTPDLFMSILHKVRDYKQIAIAGMGEPTLHPQFCALMYQAKLMGFNLIILTNLSKMDVDLFEELNRLGVNWIHASWYANKEQEKNLNEIFKLPNRITKIKLTYTPVKPGQYDTVNFIDKFRDRADALEVWQPHNWAGTFNYRKLNGLANTCGRPEKGSDILQIQSDGTVVMCCYAWDNQLALGNIKHQTITEIFEGDAYKKIVAAHRSGVYPADMLCNNCEQRNENKKDILIYSSTGIKDRQNKTSTIYEEITK